MDPPTPHTGVLITLGRNNSGKSTLAGHLLHHLHHRKPVDSRPTKFSFILDRRAEERLNHATLRGTFEHLVLPSGAAFTLLDTPGHPQFLNSAIAGISLGDVALVVVSALPEEFEPAVARGGATKDLLVVAYSFGIRHLVVAVTKLDLVDQPEERFLEIRAAMESLTIKLSFAQTAIAYVPVNAFTGDNLVTPAENRFPWYQGWKTERVPGSPSSGMTLLQALEDLRPPPPANRAQLAEGPLRMSVVRVIPQPKTGGVVCIGRVLSGVLRPGTGVTVSPSNILAKVGSVRLHKAELTEAPCGQVVSFSLPDVPTPRKGLAPAISRGSVVSETASPVAKVVRSFTARIKAVTQVELYPGQNYSLMFHASVVSCTLNDIVSTSQGATVTSHPGVVKRGDTMGEVEFALQNWRAVAPFSEVPGLGTFIAVSNRQVIAVGKVMTTSPVFVTTILPYAPSQAGHDMTALPDDCWYHIMSYLNEDSVIALGVLCRRLRALSQAPFIWRALLRLRGRESTLSMKPDFDYRLSLLLLKNARKLWHKGHHSSLRKKVRVVVCGRPQSGKSSLINALRLHAGALGEDERPRKVLEGPKSTPPSIQTLPMRDGLTEIIFSEEHGKQPGIVHNHGEKVNALIYCVDKDM